MLKRDPVLGALGQTISANRDWAIHLVVIGAEILLDSIRRSLSCHEARNNRSGVTGFVKILQI